MCVFAFAVTIFKIKPYKRRRTGGPNGVSISKKRYRIDTQTVRAHIFDENESTQLLYHLVHVVMAKENSAF